MSTAAELSPDVNLETDQRLGSRLDTLLTDAGWKRACLAFLCLGVFVPVVRYLLCFPLWNDETSLVENFISRDPWGLLAPLANQQVAPILFMWTEIAIANVAGFSEYSLRFFPFVCGTVGLFVFYYVARHYLKGLPLVMSVALISVSYFPIRHSAEVKPYAVDLLITALLLYVVTAYWKSGQIKWLVGLIVLTPLALGYSFPSVFVLGGISLSLLMPVFVRGSRNERLAYVVFNLCLVSTFLLLHFATTGDSYNVQFEQIMGWYWVEGYLPVEQPWMIPFWFLKVCASHCFEYPLGGDNGSGTVSFIGLVLGVTIFLRRCDRRVVTLGAGIIFLALIASGLKRYPFGAHARLMQYLGPLACLFIGPGFVAMLEFFRQKRVQQRAIVLTLGILAAIPVTVVIQDIVRPYKRIRYQQHRELAHNIWTQTKNENPLHCLMNSPAYAPAWEHHPYTCSQEFETGGEFMTLPAWEKLDPSQTYRGVVWYRIRDFKRAFPAWKNNIEQQFVIHDREYIRLKQKSSPKCLRS